VSVTGKDLSDGRQVAFTGGWLGLGQNRGTERQACKQDGAPGKDEMSTHALPIPIDQGFTLRPRRGYLVPRPGAGGPTTSLGRALHAAQRLLLGKPIPTAGEAGERLSKTTALAVFSSDALSSVAYATDFILITLVVAGIQAFGYAIPISLVIAGLLAVVAFSYRQTIHAYPGGGGAYGNLSCFPLPDVERVNNPNIAGKTG
jgi:hypothetical protein